MFINKPGCDMLYKCMFYAHCSLRTLATCTSNNEW